VQLRQLSHAFKHYVYQPLWHEERIGPLLVKTPLKFCGFCGNSNLLRADAL
jgi:hypothetical protein